MKFFSLLFIVCILLIDAHAQSLPVARNYQQSYNKNTRTADGKPGANYWQNKASYNINVSFAPATRIISGSEEIVYTNNSPDTLNEIWFKLYPNLYQKGAIRDMAVSEKDVTDGVRIEKILINGKEDSNFIWKDFYYPADSIKTINPGTNMTLKIEPLAPKQSVQITIQYSYILNRGSHIRTGMIDDSSAFVAYFFPRIAVYDDIDGWNKLPYTGSQEFYNDFCDFNVEVSVPKNYIVCATGNLLNADEVYNSQIVQRISEAEKNDGITKVIDTTDVENGNITVQNEINTWKFKADSATDFVFATSNHYVWYASSLVVDSSTKRRTRVDAVFNPAHKDYFNVINYARKTVESMSYKFPAWPYPYPHETVFDGLDQMEYPMMVNDNPVEDKAEEIELTDHEIFHTMFPFYMGINETKYGWMDEGWATIGEWLISPMIDTSIKDYYGMDSYNSYANYDFDMPITTLSTQENGTNYFLNSYPKPAMGYLYVKDLLGDELFAKALHYYIEQWHGKHPMPLDFFNCMNTGSSKNLNWFWKKWFYDSGAPDLAISNVKQNDNQTTVTVVMKGSKPVPIHLTIYYKDSTMQKLHETISIWEKGTSANITFTATKAIDKILLGDVHDADTDMSNNIYEIK